MYYIALTKKSSIMKNFTKMGKNRISIFDRKPLYFFAFQAFEKTACPYQILIN